MESEESLYKRGDDERWRKKVDHQQITLMTGHQVLQGLVDDLAEQIKELDAVLRGEKGEPGLISEYRRHDEMLTHLYAVVIQDSTGKKGLLHDIDALMDRRKASESRVELHWKFITAVVVALASLIGLIMTNLETIEPVLQRIEARWRHQPAVVAKKKAVRGHRRHRKPEPESTEEPRGTAQEDVPE